MVAPSNDRTLSALSQTHQTQGTPLHCGDKSKTSEMHWHRRHGEWLLWLPAEEWTSRSSQCCVRRHSCFRCVVDTATTHWTLSFTSRSWWWKWLSLVGPQMDQRDGCMP